MGLLESLLGNPNLQQDAQDFVSRYEQGPPQEGYSGQEVLHRYQQVATQVPTETYEQAAMDAFQRMSPEQRAQFAQYVQQQAQQQNVPVPTPVGGAGGSQDPRQLAQMVAGLHQQQPGMLGQLFGGGSGAGTGAGNLLDNPAAKAALAGITAMALKRMMTPR